MQSFYMNGGERGASLAHPEALGEGQRPDKVQGHWVLARAGKRVLRPGGLELTRQMLDTLAIGPQDRVVEFAPGLGVTARMVLKSHPMTYTGVEREPAAAAYLRRQFTGAGAQIVLGGAEESGLPDGCATVVYGEALLSMQSQSQKDRIVAEARRLLVSGGRYGIHELCLAPDDIPDHVRQEILAAMSKNIHMGVQPLTSKEWVELLDRNGLKTAWSGSAAMHLLKPCRLLRDEGPIGSSRILFHMATSSMLRRRIFSMRRLFNRYGSHLSAISLVAQRS